MKSRDWEIIVQLLCALLLFGLTVFAIVHAIITNCTNNACGH